MSTLRGRVMLGSVLWTLGWFAVITILLTLSPAAMHSVAVIHAHGALAAILGAACMVAALAVVRGALVPFDSMRQRLADVRQGTERQVVGKYPAEVQPLVDDLNALLAHNERVVRRATAKAGDLAHGLKTPLAVLSNEADRLSADDHTGLGAIIARQVSLMQRHVTYHLAQAGAAASGATPGAHCRVRDSAEGLSRTLMQLHADRGLTIDIRVAPGHSVRVRPEDLDEMLGNLLDNACKWARAQVSIESSLSGGDVLDVIIMVDDDGPGLAESMREVVLQRGVRADEAAPGSGLGLAIVRDLAELHGGSITLGSAPAGGLRARLSLPARKEMT